MIKTAFPPIADSNSRILLLGTMPGERSLTLRQYYAHKGNQFWKLIFSILNQQITEDYQIKVDTLLKNRIALWDVLQYCERQGSADNAIINENPNDFKTFYETYPAIRQVFFTSGKAQALYDLHVGRRPGNIYRQLPSPSSANTWKTFEEKLEEWKIIHDCLSLLDRKA